MIFKFLHNNRFELFIATQVFILFGSLLFPIEFFGNHLLPILFLINLIAGIILISKKKAVMWFFILLFIFLSVEFGTSQLSENGREEPKLMRLLVYFVFHIVVTFHIINQVWKAKMVNSKVIIGLMSGYISMGFLAFFLFLTIEIMSPGSFSGGNIASNSLDTRADELMYYAYITLLTIGYGEIIPVTPTAQKAAVLVGLAGQFYLVIITAIVVGKFISQGKDKSYQ